jgi:hypothetical protein
MSVVLQDFKLMKKYFSESDLKSSNVLTNRLLLNSVILNDKNVTFTACVFKILISRILKTYDPKIKLRFQEKYLNMLEKIKEPFKDINIILKDALDLYQIFIYEIKEEENKIYEKDLDFVNKSINFFISSVIDDLKNERFVHSIYLIFVGLLSEIDLATRTHGILLKHFILIIVTDFIHKVYEYYRILIIQSKAEGLTDCWNQKWNNLQKKIISNYESYLTLAADKYIENSIDFLFEIVKEWRLLFLRILDPFPKLPTQKNIKINEDVKEKIDKLAKLNLEKELGIE